MNLSVSHPVFLQQTRKNEFVDSHKEDTEKYTDLLTASRPTYTCNIYTPPSFFHFFLFSAFYKRFVK